MKREEIIKKILKKINTGRIDSKKIISEQSKIDFAANIRSELIDDGKILLVHDVPIAKEMVQEYTDGFHYKTAEAVDGIFVEFSPIALFHPDKHFREVGEDMQERLTIGYMSNGYTKDSKRYTDLFFFVEKTPTVVINKIKSQQSIDVSIGFYNEIDETPGNFQGKHYDKKQTKIDLDHLAVLPDATGRASFPDGVGIGADDTNNEVNKLTDDTGIKILQDQATDLKGKIEDMGQEAVKRDEKIKALEAKVDEQKKSLDEKKVEQLTADSAELKTMKDKLKADEATKKKELTDAILEKNTDEKFKLFVEKCDSIEQLEYIKTQQDTKVNGLPAGKNGDAETQMDQAWNHTKAKNDKSGFKKPGKGAE